METTELIKALASAAAKPPQEYCIAWTLTSWWPLCMAKGEWAAWMQGLGSVLGLGVAIWLPWHDRRVKQRADRQKAIDESDLTIRFHSHVFETNESMLRVASKRLDVFRRTKRPDAASEVISAIGALRALEFEHIKIVAGGHPDIARLLADFRCELLYATEVINNNGGLETFDQLAGTVLAPTIEHRLSKLTSIAEDIRNLTVNYR